MKEYSCLKALYLSFYSRGLYRDVAKNWGADVVFYLLLLLAICWAIMMIEIQPVINQGFKQFANKISDQLPHVVVENGQVHTPENIPYLIKEPDSGEVVAIVDTSGKYKSLEDLPNGAKVLLTKDKLIYQDNENTTKIYQLPASLNFDFEASAVKETLVKFVNWTWIILFPICLFFSFIYRLIQAVFYAVLGKIFSALGSTPSLDYSTIFKLTIVAITPAIVIGTILDLLHISFPLEWIMFFVISMVYLIFAIRANKET